MPVTSKELQSRPVNVCLSHLLRAFKELNRTMLKIFQKCREEKHPEELP